MENAKDGPPRRDSLRAYKITLDDGCRHKSITPGSLLEGKRMTDIISRPSEVMKHIQLTQLEHELMDVRLEMRRLEGVINSPKVKSRKYKDESKKKLGKLIKEKNKLTDIITEVMLLDGDL